MLEEMTYKEVDGLLYPQIEMPDETEDLTKLGKYGRMAMNYLKENEPARYKTLMRFGKMYEKMSAVEEEANQLYASWRCSTWRSTSHRIRHRQWRCGR